MSSCLFFYRHFYDNPIQLVGKSAFQHLPELRTLYVFIFILVFFSYCNTRVVPHFHHRNFNEIDFFNCRTLNGASQLTEFPDLTGTTSLESL